MQSPETIYQQPPNSTETGAEKVTDLLNIELNGDSYELFVQGTPETIGQEKFALPFIKYLPENYKFAQMLGYNIDQTTDGWQIKLPTTDTLNTVRKEKLSATDANTTELVMHEGGKLSGYEYLSYLAAGKVPIASDIEYLHHDYVHALGFIKLSKEMFALVQRASEQALLKGNPDNINHLTGIIDELTAQASIATTSLKVPEVLLEGVLFPAVKKRQLEKRQSGLFKHLNAKAI